MNPLIKQEHPIDISFGIPPDIKELHVPWAFYDQLGISRDASEDDIAKAYKKLARKHHPDFGGDPNKFKTITFIKNTLLDNGGPLGRSHSKRAHYDKASQLDNLCSAYIIGDGIRSFKFSELLLSKLLREKEVAQFEYEVGEKFPEFPKIKRRYERTQREDLKLRYSRELRRIIDKARGIPPEMRREMRKQYVDFQEKKKAEVQRFFSYFLRNPQKFYTDILDIFYLGGTITFNNQHYGRKVDGVDFRPSRGHLGLLLQADTLLPGFKRVHLKSDEQTTVNLEANNLDGIVHLTQGTINVKYGFSPSVIKVAAPTVNATGDYVKKGDRYIHRGCAAKNWEKSLHLILAVQEGEVNLYF